MNIFLSLTGLKSALAKCPFFSHWWRVASRAGQYLRGWKIPWSPQILQASAGLVRPLDPEFTRDLHPTLSHWSPCWVLEPSRGPGEALRSELTGHRRRPSDARCCPCCPSLTSAFGLYCHHGQLKIQPLQLSPRNRAPHLQLKHLFVEFLHRAIC